MLLTEKPTGEGEGQAEGEAPTAEGTGEEQAEVSTAEGEGVEGEQKEGEADGEKEEKPEGGFDC